MNELDHKKTEFRYAVSVLIVTYHPDYVKLRQTILSAIFQKDTSIEIIIADDGSEKNYKDELVDLFGEQGFTDYKLVMNEKNQGTIRNLISGIEVAEGEYVKDLSPGDFLSDEYVLRDWLSYMRREGCPWSFSEVIYYHDKGGEEVISTEMAQPVYLDPYLKKKEKWARWNYVVLDDVAPGSAFMALTSLMERYLKELAAIGNKYAEDYMYRVMMFDGICGMYYSVPTVFYEYGTGISTGRDRVWAKRLFAEYIRMNRLLKSRERTDAFQKRMLRYTARKTSAVAMLLVPGKLRRFLRLNYFPRKHFYDMNASADWRKQCRL